MPVVDAKYGTSLKPCSCSAEVEAMRRVMVWLGSDHSKLFPEVTVVPAITRVATLLDPVRDSIGEAPLKKISCIKKTMTQAAMNEKIATIIFCFF